MEETVRDTYQFWLDNRRYEFVVSGWAFENDNLNAYVEFIGLNKLSVNKLSHNFITQHAEKIKNASENSLPV